MLKHNWDPKKTTTAVSSASGQDFEMTSLYKFRYNVRTKRHLFSVSGYFSTYPISIEQAKQYYFLSLLRSTPKAPPIMAPRIGPNTGTTAPTPAPVTIPATALPPPLAELLTTIPFLTASSSAASAMSTISPTDVPSTLATVRSWSSEMAESPFSIRDQLDAAIPTAAAKSLCLIPLAPLRVARTCPRTAAEVVTVLISLMQSSA